MRASSNTLRWLIRDILREAADGRRIQLSRHRAYRYRSRCELETFSGIDQLAVANGIYRKRSLDIELNDHGLSVLAEDDALRCFAAGDLVGLVRGAVLDLEQEDLAELVAAGVVGGEVRSCHARDGD